MCNNADCGTFAPNRAVRIRKGVCTMNQLKLTHRDETVSALKDRAEDEGSTLIGQVIAGGIQQYVVVEVTGDGLTLMPLYGTFLGEVGKTETFFAANDKTGLLMDRERCRGYMKKRWDEIAEMYPAINDLDNN